MYANQEQLLEGDIRHLVALHTLNHIYKSRDVVMHHNTIIKKQVAANETTRKPDDFNHTFAGNIDDCFKIGIKFSKKQMKLYASFYSCDMIVCSPLGLSMIIGVPGDKKRDYDYLSSIEILVLDHAELFLMQNWDHVKTIFDHLNLIPTNAHGCDFSRARNYILDGHAKYVRQNLVFSHQQAPEINALTKYCKNIAGAVKITQTYEGSVGDVVVQVPQVFYRVPSSTLGGSADARFDFFINKILPTLRMDKLEQSNTAIV
ncbi:hypothetical protein HDU91_003539, partial [Kappamyces sp. JEL0680]